MIIRQLTPLRKL